MSTCNHLHVMCKNIYINNHTTITNYIHGDTRETFIYLHDLPSRMLDPLSGYLQKFTVDTLYKFSNIEVVNSSSSGSDVHGWVNSKRKKSHKTIIPLRHRDIYP